MYVMQEQRMSVEETLMTGPENWFIWEQNQDQKLTDYSIPAVIELLLVAMLSSKKKRPGDGMI